MTAINRSLHRMEVLMKSMGKITGSSETPLVLMESMNRAILSGVLPGELLRVIEDLHKREIEKGFKPIIK